MIVPSRRWEIIASSLESTTAASNRAAENSSGKPSTAQNGRRHVTPPRFDVQPERGSAAPNKQEPTVPDA